MPAQAGVSPEVGEVELAEALRFDHMLDVDVAGPGTGISFTPATRYEHKSGDAVQSLGSGIVLDSPLAGSHEAGAPVSVSAVAPSGYQEVKFLTSGMEQPFQPLPDHWRLWMHPAMQWLMQWFTDLNRAIPAPTGQLQV
jgi:hypothetical protein